MALFLWPESSYKSPNCIHKSPDSPNSGHAIYYVLITGVPKCSLETCKNFVAKEKVPSHKHLLKRSSIDGDF